MNHPTQGFRASLRGRAISCLDDDCDFDTQAELTFIMAEGVAHFSPRDGGQFA